MSAAPVPAAIGFAVIAVTGVGELIARSERRLAVEEALSCVAVVCIVGWSGGRVDVVSLLWLVAAASGVLARGGRVGPVGRVLVVGALFSPLVTMGSMSPENLGFAFGSIALLLATGRISREQTELLRRARHDAAHDSLTGVLSRRAFRSHVDSLAGSRPLTGERSDPDRPRQVRRGEQAPRSRRRGSPPPADGVRDGALPAGRGHHREGRRRRVHRARDRRRPRVRGAPADRRGRERRPSSATACAGIARCPRDGDSAEALLAAADVALRLAKRETGSTSVYVGAPMSSRSAYGARAALERLCRGEGLEMATQPLVDVKLAEIHAYEALARFDTRGGQGPLH